MQGDTQTSDGFRILLADDHGLIRQVVGAMLERYPTLSIVGEAADGMEAISQAALLKPDGIIMDINMPKIDGIDATKQIKAAQPMIRIIGLSVIDDEHVRQAMKAAGAEAVLLKDEIHELDEALQQWTLRQETGKLLHAHNPIIEQ
ncbi:MAG: response regulator transcription factor [Nitrospirales bacterium]